jgi:hypothetical protein
VPAQWPDARRRVVDSKGVHHVLDHVISLSRLEGRALSMRRHLFLKKIFVVTETLRLFRKKFLFAENTSIKLKKSIEKSTYFSCLMKMMNNEEKIKGRNLLNEKKCSRE